MHEFLLNYKNTITFSVELLAAVTGLILYKYYKTTTAKFFIGFLVYFLIFPLRFSIKLVVYMIVLISTGNSKNTVSSSQLFSQDLIA